MPFSRRDFLDLSAEGIVAGLVAAIPLTAAAADQEIKAITFVAFPIFDPRPVFVLAEQLFPGRGVELSNALHARQFEFQWFRAFSDRYADFWHCRI